MIGNVSVGQQFDGMTALLQIIADPAGAAAFLAEAKTTLAATKAAAEEAQATMAEAEGKLKAAEGKMADGNRALATAAKLASDNAFDAADTAKAKAALDKARADLNDRERELVARGAGLDAAMRAFARKQADTEAQLAARDTKLAADQAVIDDMKATLSTKLDQIKALAL
jgi:hypothetical protein